MDIGQHSDWICPKCGNPNISGTLIACPKCGKKRNRWGYWDCESCATKSIRADHKECPNCGRPRARTVKFYLRDDLWEFVDEVSGQAAVRIGRANWICPYCNQQNDDSVQSCVYCNAARSESTERYHDVQPEGRMPAQDLPKIQRKKRVQSVLFCCGLPLGILLVLFLFVCIVTGIDYASSQKLRQTEDYTVYWQSSVYLEEYKTFRENDWELPDGVRLVETREEEYTYIDHYEERSREVWVDDYDNDDWGGGWDDGGWGGGWDDYGDGQFGMLHIPLYACTIPTPQIVPVRYETEYYQEPIYKTELRTKYYYEYEAWAEGRTVIERGKPGTEPYYGEVNLSDNERERERITEFYVMFTHKDDPVSMPITQAQYEQIIADGMVLYRCDVTESSSNPKYFVVNGDLQ